MNKWIKSLRQAAFRQVCMLKAKVHDLNYFFWETTLRCNLSCRHCGSDCRKEEQFPELPGERVKQVFQNLAEHYRPEEIMVAVTGGEPLLRDDLFEVMAEVNRLGFPWGMVTNGLLVDEKAITDCLKTGMRTVVVSLDGIGETHDWLRNHPNAYQGAVRALQLFLEPKVFKQVEVITCVNHRNIDQLEEIYHNIRKMGVHSWRLFTIFPRGRAYNSELLPNRQLLLRLFDFIAGKRREDPSWPVNYSEEGYLGCKWEHEVRSYFYYCGAGINIGSLLCDGSYSACPSLSREWIQGNVDELPFSEAWETRYNLFRNREWRRNSFCGECRAWKYCQGSSLHLWNFQKKQPEICHWRVIRADNK